VRLLTIGSLPPEWGGPARGGVATFHASLLEGLRGAGGDIEIAGVAPPAPLEAPAPVPVFERPAEVSIESFYSDLLERVAPDVVLMNHVANTIGVTHAGLASAPPAVGVVHSWHNVTLASPERAVRQREVTQAALGGLAAMAVGSQHCLVEGRSLGLRYPPVAEAIHYPLQSLYLQPVDDIDTRERDGVLFLGSLVPRKNPEALVEAAMSLPARNVTLAGEGELESALRESIGRRGLVGRVRIVGHFDIAEHLRGIRDLLCTSMVMCMPSSSESFGLAFIEALACGTPIVGFGPTVREIREAMGIEIGEPLDAPGPEAIAAAIERVETASWDRGELRRAAAATFHPDRVTRRYIDLLGRVR
jgi:glycosyltransferase involved in cell wall biosynthesis